MFNSQTAKIAGAISKRNKALPLEMKQSLQLIASDILNTIELDKLNTNQRLKLLEIVLKFTMPKDVKIMQEKLPNEITFEIIKSTP
jgi:hypothetical protein